MAAGLATGERDSFLYKKLFSVLPLTLGAWSASQAEADLSFVLHRPPHLSPCPSRPPHLAALPPLHHHQLPRLLLPHHLSHHKADGAPY